MLFTLVRSASIAYRGGMSTPSTAITHSRRGILTVLLGALFFSVSAIVIKLAAVEPITTATLRCAIAVPLLALLALREKSSHGALSGRNIWWSIAAGIALGIDYAAWTASIFKVGAGVSTVLLNFQVIVLPLLAWMFDKEPVSRRFKLAAPVMLLGIGMLGGLWGSSELGPEVLTGTALALLAGVGYGIYMFITRRGRAGDRVATRPSRQREPQPLHNGESAAGPTGLRSDHRSDRSRRTSHSDPAARGRSGRPGCGGVPWAVVATLGRVRQPPSIAVGKPHTHHARAAADLGFNYAVRSINRPNFKERPCPSPTVSSTHQLEIW